MKQIAVLVFTLALFSGCATKPAVVEPDHAPIPDREKLVSYAPSNDLEIRLAKNIADIIDSVESLNNIAKMSETALRIVEAFQKQYNTEQINIAAEKYYAHTNTLLILIKDHNTTTKAYITDYQTYKEHPDPGMLKTLVERTNAYFSNESAILSFMKTHLDMEDEIEALMYSHNFSSESIL
jgi:glutamate-1-semialdehyde aminotransferase